MNNLLDLTFKRKINCSAEVAWWNYWDHEHLDVVHKAYKKSDILYDDKNFMFRVDEIKIPIIPFLKFKSPLFLVQHDKNTLFGFAIQFGILSKTTIKILSIERSKCSISMNYKFYLNGWRIILKPILKKLIPVWNETVWNEDLPIKLRRQKVIDMNFKDFIGLPKDLKDRKYDGPIKFTLPIRRPKKSSRDLHPLKK